MTPSITRDFAISPSEEYSPVVGPNTKKDITTEVISTTRSAVPIFMLECAFKIMAMLSVPPLDAPMLNKTADPTAGRKIAKISSSIGWSVMVPANGTKRSRALKLKDISMLAYTVLMPTSVPKNKKPMTRSPVFTMNVKSLAFMPVSLLTTDEKPVTPPKEKLFGNLKK